MLYEASLTTVESTDPSVEHLYEVMESMTEKQRDVLRMVKEDIQLVSWWQKRNRHLERTRKSRYQITNRQG